MASLFSPKINLPTPPTPKPVPKMPDPSDPMVAEARRAATVKALGRAGRQSTILTGRPTYDSYAGTKVG